MSKIQTVKIYGGSDDLIEIEGNIKGCDEYNGDLGYAEFSSGDVFKIEYTKGVWKVDHFKHGGLISVMNGKVTKKPHGEGDDPEPHTDTVTITGELEWVIFSESWPIKRAEKVERIRHWIECGDGDIDNMPDARIDDLFKYICIGKPV